MLQARPLAQGIVPKREFTRQKLTPTDGPRHAATMFIQLKEEVSTSEQSRSFGDLAEIISQKRLQDLKARRDSINKEIEQKNEQEIVITSKMEELSEQAVKEIAATSQSSSSSSSQSTPSATPSIETPLSAAELNEIMPKLKHSLRETREERDGLLKRWTIVDKQCTKLQKEYKEQQQDAAVLKAKLTASLDPFLIQLVDQFYAEAKSDSKSEIEAFNFSHDSLKDQFKIKMNSVCQEILSDINNVGISDNTIDGLAKVVSEINCYFLEMGRFLTLYGQENMSARDQLLPMEDLFEIVLRRIPGAAVAVEAAWRTCEDKTWPNAVKTIQQKVASQVARIPLSTQSLQHSASTSMLSMLDSPARQDRGRTLSPAATRRVCHEFARSGTCSRGDRCGYEHDSAAASQAGSTPKRVRGTSQPPPKSPSWTSSSSNPSTQSSSRQQHPPATFPSWSTAGSSSESKGK